MFKKTDPYTYTKYCPLFNGTDQIGNLFLEYQVTYYDDVQLADFTVVTNIAKRKFLVHCTQKINIWNPTAGAANPGGSIGRYLNYPALIITAMKIKDGSGADWHLLNYSPQTVNTKIESSHSDTDGQGNIQTNSRSNTAGSSTSQSNSYGASVSAGLMDASVSSHYDHSSTTSQDQSSTTGRESSQSENHDLSGSASMSVKDWGAYAMVIPTTESPTWTFGQEYPWDAIQCRTTDSTDVNPEGQIYVLIPEEMHARMVGVDALDINNKDAPFVYPPSHLSSFGMNFVVKALWLVTVDDVSSGSSDKIEIDHEVNYFSASHYFDAPDGQTASGAVVYIDPLPTLLLATPAPGAPVTASTTIDLPLMALDPLGIRDKAAIIGFIPNQFVVRPAPAQKSAAAVPFKIVSNTNDLIVLDTTDYPASTDAGAGFTASLTELAAGFSANCPAVQMTIYFKVIDSVSDYTLFMKHWKTGTSDIALTFVINGDESNPVTKYVGALEAEGGERNVLSFALRSQDFASVDYNDYLRLGLNSVQISVHPVDGNVAAGYQIRAISIEKV